MDQYQGYKNYQTWVYKLYNDLPEEYVYGCLDEVFDPKINLIEVKYKAIFTMEEELKESLLEQIEFFTENTHGLFYDLLTSAINLIDFKEIAEDSINNYFKYWLEERTGIKYDDQNCL